MHMRKYLSLGFTLGSYRRRTEPCHVNDTSICMYTCHIVGTFRPTDTNLRQLCGVSLHLTSSPKEFSWHLIFADENVIPHLLVYRQISNISRTFVGNQIVGAAPTTSIFILNLIHGFNRLGKDNCKTRRETIKF